MQPRVHARAGAHYNPDGPGLGNGSNAHIATPTPTVEPTATPTAEPTATPSPSPTVAGSPDPSVDAATTEATATTEAAATAEAVATPDADEGKGGMTVVTEAPTYVVSPVVDTPTDAAQTVTLTELPNDPLIGATNDGVPTLWVVLGAVILLAAIATALILNNRGKSKQKKTDRITERTDPIDPVTAVLPLQDVLVGKAQHIGNRENQQDSFYVSDPAEESTRGLLAVVADGMGGLRNGAEISQAAVATIRTGFALMSPDVDPALRLIKVAMTAQQTVRALNEKDDAGGGSTLVMAYVRQNQLYTLSIGDSRIYLLRDGALMQLNREHIYAVELDERAAKGEISFEDAAKDPQRTALTSYLGMSELALIDRTIRPFPLKRGDRIALMSDGVFGTISNAELQALLAKDAYSAAASIQEAVLSKRKPHQDNLTVVIIEYQK